MTDPSRAELWMTFAAAAMGIGDASENTATAAKAADRMLAEFDKRFMPSERDAGTDCWIERPAGAQA